jgi:hypothetical protein
MCLPRCIARGAGVRHLRVHDLCAGPAAGAGGCGAGIRGGGRGVRYRGSTGPRRPAIAPGGPQRPGVMLASHGPVGLHHHRRRLCRLRAGEPALCKPRAQGPAAGSRWYRPAAVGADPHRVRPDIPRSFGQLDVPDAAGPGPWRSLVLLAPWQGAGRVRLDQRDGLCARAAGRLRCLGAAGQPGLGLGRCVAVLPALRRPCRGCQHVPRVRWAHAGDRHRGPGASAVRSVFWMRRSPSGLDAPQTSMARRAKASASTRSAPATACASPAPLPFCDLRCNGPNLMVHTHAHATRLLTEGRRAVGVQYLRGGTYRSRRGPGAR